MTGKTRALSEILEELHQTLERVSEIGSEEREALRLAARDIRGALGRAPAEGESSLSEQLRDAVERFEDSHPKLTQVVGRVADALSDIGI